MERLKSMSTQITPELIESQYHRHEINSVTATEIDITLVETKDEIGNVIEYAILYRSKDGQDMKLVIDESDEVSFIFEMIRLGNGERLS